MTKYKIYVSDRKYSSWEIYETNTFQKVDITVKPIESKLFSNDVFEFDDNNVDNTIPRVVNRCRNSEKWLPDEDEFSKEIDNYIIKFCTYIFMIKITP